ERARSAARLLRVCRRRAMRAPHAIRFRRRAWSRYSWTRGGFLADTFAQRIQLAAQFRRLRRTLEALGEIADGRMRVAEPLRAPRARIDGTGMSGVDRQRLLVELQRTHDVSLLAHDVAETCAGAEHLQLPVEQAGEDLARLVVLALAELRAAEQE